MHSFDRPILLGARDSLLSRAQVAELLTVLQTHHPLLAFSTRWFKTTGDLDQITPLSSLEKTDFFTKEIDEAVLEGSCQIGVHSAKDLSEKLAEGLTVVAYTQSIDPTDVIVLKEGQNLEDLPLKAKIGTSSLRREVNIKALRSDFICGDIRGTIEKRLELLDQGAFDAVIVAKAALLRLKLVRNIVELPGEPCPGQGSLAVVAKENDVAMEHLFTCLQQSFI